MMMLSNPASQNTGLPIETLMKVFLDSFLASARQRLIGERRQVGSAICVHYDYFWKGQHLFAENFFIPAESDLPDTLSTIAAYGPVSANQIFVPFNETVPETMARFRCLNLGQHYLMERPITALDQHLTPRYPVEQVTSSSQLKYFNGVPGGSLAIRTDILENDFRFYYLQNGGTSVSQARTWFWRPTISWESQVNTDPNFQRLGFGTAVMTHLLRENAKQGIKSSTLLATGAGFRLYKGVGYTNRMTIGCYKWMNKEYND